MSDKEFKNNLASLGVVWEAAPDYDKIKNIKERIIIGPNGCGKSRFLSALSTTLEKNDVGQTDIIYADFPEMARLERQGINENELELLRKIFSDRRNTPIRETLILVSSHPIRGIASLVALSKTDRYCRKAVAKAEQFLKPMFGEDFKLSNVANYFGEDKPLSPGQRSLFYMSVMLGVLAAHHSNDEFYILLDEPDQHLHAKSIVDFVKQIQEQLPKAKLWIATHSVHLMTHFKFDDIIYIDNCKVQQNNSTIYDEICKTMVDTKGMQQFVSFSGLYGFYEFFRECFSAPTAESEVNEDKLKPLKKRVQERNIKTILDYGAGKGRFFALLSAIPSIEYNAFECFPQYHEELNALISSPGKVYTKETEMPDNTFDAVLLINTLHEIPLQEWLRVFETIKRILKDDGCLFFCETAPLITGEKIINTGFLVLGTVEQSKLFGVESIYLDQKQKLHFSEIPKNQIPTLTEEKLTATLELLKTSSFENWEREDKNARNAAFYAVQHLNAEKALKQLPDIFEKAIKRLPDTFEKAVTLAQKQKAVDLEPENALYQISLGIKLHAMNRYDEALVAKQEAVKLEPENALYQNSLGITLYAMNRYDEALVAYQKAAELEPENRQYQSRLNITLNAMKK